MLLDFHISACENTGLIGSFLLIVLLAKLFNLFSDVRCFSFSFCCTSQCFVIITVQQYVSSCAYFYCNCIFVFFCQ